MTKLIKLDGELTNTRIQPQESLPAETDVELLHVGPLTRTESPERRSHDAQQCNSAALCLASALLCDAVDGARLLIYLQP